MIAMFNFLLLFELIQKPNLYLPLRLYKYIEGRQCGFDSQA